MSAPLHFWNGVLCVFEWDLYRVCVDCVYEADAGLPVCQGS